MNKIILLNTKTFCSILLLGLLGCVSTGCGSSSLDSAQEVPEVNGTVLLPTGGPLKGGKILLRPCSGVRNARNLSGDINADGSFTIRSNDIDRAIIATDYKVFISLNTDPKHRGLKRLVPKKYQDVTEDDFETDLFVNLAEQADGIVLKMTKG